MGKPPRGEVGFKAPPDLAAGRRWAEVSEAEDSQMAVSMEEVASTEVGVFTEGEAPTGEDIAKK
jgi:hypothetical protein